MSDRSTQMPPKRRTRRDIILLLAFPLAGIGSIAAAANGIRHGRKFKTNYPTAEKSHKKQPGHSLESLAYLMVMPGIAATLALNRLLVGAALLVRQRKDIEFRRMIEVPWALWALLLFFLLIQYWHTTSMCAQAGEVGDNLLQYAFFFAFPAMTYLAYTVLIPHEVPPRGSLDLTKHYYDHAMPFFIICSIGMALEVALSEHLQCAPPGVPTDLKGENSLRLAASLAALVLVFTQCVLGAGWKRTAMHWIVTSYAIALFCSFVYFFRPSSSCRGECETPGAVYGEATVGINAMPAECLTASSNKTLFLDRATPKAGC